MKIVVTESAHTSVTYHQHSISTLEYIDLISEVIFF